MPFPEIERVIYERNPLIEVICQLRFPEILVIKTKDPDEFQEKIRDNYSVYNKRREPKPLPGMPPELPSFMGFGSEKVIHEFSKEDGSWQINLSSDFIAILTNKYIRYEEFRKNTELALDALKTIYRPSFFNRIGLRYKDLINKQAIKEIKDLEWKDLLSSSIIGEFNDTHIGKEIVEFNKNFAVEIEEGIVKIRHGLVKKEGQEEPCYLIDADFFTHDRKEVSDGIRILNGFNKIAGRLFRWAITEKLHMAMDPKVV